MVFFHWFFFLKFKPLIKMLMPIYTLYINFDFIYCWEKRGCSVATIKKTGTGGCSLLKQNPTKAFLKFRGFKATNKKEQDNLWTISLLYFWKNAKMLHHHQKKQLLVFLATNNNQFNCQLIKCIILFLKSKWVNCMIQKNWTKLFFSMFLVIN